VLLQAGQHREIALIKYRAAVPLHVAGACTLLLFGSSMLRHGDAVMARSLGQRPRGIELSRGEIWLRD
jgi:hypothetical protein